MRDSVISPDVKIEAGASVRDSVLLHGVVVRSGAIVERAIIDQGVEIGADARVGGDGDIALGRWRVETGEGDRRSARRSPPRTRGPGQAGRRLTARG